MIRIKVPATSANIGPGFDVFGMALDLYNEFVFEDSDDFGGDNLVYEAYKYTFDKYEKNAEPVDIEIITNIPIARGLGSSSTCIVAGIAAALLKIEGEIDRERVLEIATEIEGHPDNVAPAIFGSLVTSVIDSDRIFYNINNPHSDLGFVAIIPDFELSTKKAREILPESVSREDSIFNTSRSCLLIPALEKLDEEMIKACLKDRLHEPYRKSLIKGYGDIESEADRVGAIGTYLSGAGPTIISIYNKLEKDIPESIKSFANKNFPGWEIKSLNLDTEGIQYTEG
ncbi:MAG: homoserine kinase [Tissierellia bacterium]|nr:homoserine kinase [Tissierellia bacterium]